MMYGSAELDEGHYYNLKAEYKLLLDWAMYDQHDTR